MAGDFSSSGFFCNENEGYKVKWFVMKTKDIKWNDFKTFNLPCLFVYAFWKNDSIFTFSFEW